MRSVQSDSGLGIRFHHIISGLQRSVIILFYIIVLIIRIINGDRYKLCRSAALRIYFLHEAGITAVAALYHIFQRNQIKFFFRHCGNRNFQSICLFCVYLKGYIYWLKSSFP